MKYLHSSILILMVILLILSIIILYLLGTKEKKENIEVTEITKNEKRKVQEIARELFPCIVNAVNKQELQLLDSWKKNMDSKFLQGLENAATKYSWVELISASVFGWQSSPTKEISIKIVSIQQDSNNLKKNIVDILYFQPTLSGEWELFKIKTNEEEK